MQSNRVISFIFTFNKKYVHKNKMNYNKKYYFHKNKRYVINTELHIHCFLFIFIALVYFAQEYIPLNLQSRGICILAQNKLMQ